MGASLTLLFNKNFCFDLCNQTFHKWHSFCGCFRKPRNYLGYGSKTTLPDLSSPNKLNKKPPEHTERRESLNSVGSVLTNRNSEKLGSPVFSSVVSSQHGGSQSSLQSKRASKVPVAQSRLDKEKQNLKQGKQPAEAGNPNSRMSDTYSVTSDFQHLEEIEERVRMLNLDNDLQTDLQQLRTSEYTWRFQQIMFLNVFFLWYLETVAI